MKREMYEFSSFNVFPTLLFYSVIKAFVYPRFLGLNHYLLI